MFQISSTPIDAPTLQRAMADPKAGAVETLFSIGTDARLNHRFEVTRGVCETESSERLRSFFMQLRMAGEK